MSRNPDRLARLLKVLSVGTRLRIVQLLKGRALCVNALAARLDVTQGAVSQHLRVMRDAGLVIDEKRGCFVHYRLNDKTLATWRMTIGELLTPAERGRHPRKRSEGMCCCNEKKGCQKPENLKGKPQDCTPEQVKKCHGDARKHPCVKPPRR